MNSVVIETVHILGKQRPALGPVRYGRVFNDNEFDTIQRIGLPRGWVAWHIRGDETRKMKAMRLIPVMVQPGTMEPADPIPELLEDICDIRAYVELQTIANCMPKEHTAQAA